MNLTSFVDMSFLEIISTTISSITSTPLLESSTTALTPKSETESEGESPDALSPTNPPSMFSTSMAPPQPARQEEELVTTVEPTIKEEHEDTADVTDLDIDDFVNENVTAVEFAQRGDTFPEPQSTTDGPDSMSKPIQEPDDHSVIEINTIQPDVPILDASVITEPMFAEGKTEETILDSGITTAMASDLDDLATESAELTDGEVLGFSESTPLTGWLHSTTPFPDYDLNTDEIETIFAVEGPPPPQPSQHDLVSSLSDSESDGTISIQTHTSLSSELEITTTETPQTTSTSTQTAPQIQDAETLPTASTILIDGEMLAEDVTSSTSVHVFDESTIQLPEHSGDSLSEDNTAAEIGTEFFTYVPLPSAVAATTTTPDARSVQVSTVQNVSGKT